MALTSGTASVTSTSATSIVVTCGAATGGTGTYTYQWYRSDSTGSVWTLVPSATSLTLTDSTVVQGTAYDYELKSTDSGNSAFVYSNRVNALATPSYSAINPDAVGATGLPAQVMEVASGGSLSNYPFLSTAAVQVASIKASAGNIYGMSFFNSSSTICYVRLYNQATSPASTDGANIIWRGTIPANTLGTGFVISMSVPLAFSTGIGIRVTASVADNDTTALAANAIIGNIRWN